MADKNNKVIWDDVLPHTQIRRLETIDVEFQPLSGKNLSHPLICIISGELI